MAIWKPPPRAKAFEALTAVVDDRVRRTGPTTAEVVSSDSTKIYVVTWSEEMQKITSNDNASYWQGYVGYPIIAVLLATGKISFDAEAVRDLSGVPWSKLNKEHRRDYEAVIQGLLTGIAERGGKPEVIVKEVERILQTLGTLHLEQLPHQRKPPQSSSS